ncbi:hypothetical protein AUP68_18091 [Ilyonectria robusta]
MKYFSHLPDLRLLCCRSYLTLVARRRITPYLRGNPHKLKKQIDSVRQWAAKLDLIDGEDEILTILFIPNDSPPIKALRANSRIIRDHLSIIHDVNLGSTPSPQSATITELAWKWPRYHNFTSGTVQSRGGYRRGNASISGQGQKKEENDIEERGDLAFPNAWLRRLGAPTNLKDFSEKKDLLRSLVSL